mgnify:CR=1 FL=1
MSPATLRFWADRFIWTSPRHVGAETSRPAVAILIGGWGDLTLGHEARTLSGRALVIGPNVKRSIAAEHGFYSFNLDPVHRLSRSLRQTCAASGGVIDLSARLDAAVHDSVAGAIAHLRKAIRDDSVAIEVVEQNEPSPVSPTPRPSSHMRLAAREETPDDSGDEVSSYTYWVSPIFSRASSEKCTSPLRKMTPVICWMWWPHSWASTYIWARGPASVPNCSRSTVRAARRTG